MRRRELLAHLRSHGCILIREGARHSWWGNPANNRRTAVPRHRDLTNVLARKICRDLGIPHLEESIALLAPAGCLIAMPAVDGGKDAIE